MYWKGGDIEGQFKHIISLQLIDRNDKSLTVLPVVHQVGTHGHIFPFLLFFFLFFSLKMLEVVRVTDTKILCHFVFNPGFGLQIHPASVSIVETFCI